MGVLKVKDGSGNWIPIGVGIPSPAYIGHAVQSGNQNVGAGATDLPGMSVSFTVPDTSRKYLIIATAVARQNTAAGTVSAGLTSIPAGGQTIQQSLAINEQKAFTVLWILTGVSGAYTVKMQGSTSAGTADFLSAAGTRTHLVVVDIGY